LTIQFFFPYIRIPFLNVTFWRYKNHRTEKPGSTIGFFILDKVTNTTISVSLKFTSIVLSITWVFNIKLLTNRNSSCLQALF